MFGFNIEKWNDLILLLFFWDLSIIINNRDLFGICLKFNSIKKYSCHDSRMYL